MTDWIERYAREVLVLDAYVTNHRVHVFYERNGFRIVGYHFVKVSSDFGNRIPKHIRNERWRSGLDLGVRCTIIEQR